MATASPIAPIPARIRRKGAFFTRGTSKDRMARYSEEGADYQENMERLLKKHHTARKLVPPAIAAKAARTDEAGRDLFRLHQRGDDRGRRNPGQEQGVTLDLLRVRGFPFGDEVEAFIAEHDKVFVVEQNRDGQLRMLLINELEIDPAKLVKILHYDGTPITARFIAGAIGEQLESDKIVPLRKVVP